ncbi:MAG: transcriptional regulator BetI [Pseudomonadota bacterium]
MKQKVSDRPGGNRVAAREARRQQLINATIDSISKRGFSGTTLSTVTETAKLSHGVVNFYFESKEALYVETLGYLAEEHFQAWHQAMQAAGSNPARQLAAIVETDFDRGICSPKKLAVWFAFWGQAKYRPNYLKIHGKYDDQRFKEISRLCTEIVAVGEYVSLDPDVVARNLEALIDGIWLSLLLYPSGKNRQQARADVYAFLAMTFPRHFEPVALPGDNCSCGVAAPRSGAAAQ